MFQAPLKILIYMASFIVLLLFLVGAVRWQPQDYDCLGSWNYGFREKVEVVRLNNLVFYAYPFTRDCPVEQRYERGQLDEILRKVQENEQATQIR